MHILDTWIGSEVRGAESTPGIRTGAPAASPASRVPDPTGRLGIASATPAAAPSAASGILASYVGQALAQRYVKNAAAGGTERWPQADQGCRLGNYESTSALCRAAALAVHGWGDTRAIPFEEVVEFCDADYFEEALALCVSRVIVLVLLSIRRLPSEYRAEMSMESPNLRLPSHCDLTSRGT
jgi:hypothetical protein